MGLAEYVEGGVGVGRGGGRRRVLARDARQREDKGNEMAAIYYVQAGRAARPQKMGKQEQLPDEKGEVLLVV